MAKDYNKAYDLAQQDAASGENKLAMRSFKRLLNIGSYLPGFEGRDAEFFDGYKDGFRDKVRIIQTSTVTEASMSDTQGKGKGEGSVEINTQRPTENQQTHSTGSAAASTTAALGGLQTQVQAVTHSTLTGGASVSAPTLAQQILSLTKLKESLEKFRHDVIISSQQYQDAVNYLGANILQEMRDSYAQKQLVATQRLSKELTDHMMANDIKALEEKINDLRAILSKQNSR